MEEIIKNATLFKIIEKEWKQIPMVVRQFIVRAALLLAFWFIAYTCFLKPDATVDNWLTKVTAQATTSCLNNFYKHGFTVLPQANDDDGIKASITQLIHFQDKFALLIISGCNGFDVYATFIGFLVCVPGAFYRKLQYTTLGIIIIFILNVQRCYLLVWLNLNKPEWTDFAHHYAFTTIVYAFIFSIWVSFMKKTKGSEA